MPNGLTSLYVQPASTLSKINLAELASDDYDSPRADKLVDVCKNCNFSFRPGTKSLDGFCSKGK